jgi:ABC-type multidrug transport system fused ATPase/permease subunit
MEVLDSSLSGSVRAVMFRLATFFASILTVTYVFPLFLIPASIISYMYARISKGYISAGRDMRRMQSTTRSPIFAGFAETLEGIVTVRAFGAERRFLSILLRRIDLTTKVSHLWRPGNPTELLIDVVWLVE